MRRLLRDNSEEQSMNIRSGFRIMALLAAAAALHAQIVIEFGGEKNATQFAYGFGNQPALNVAIGNGSTGAGATITLVSGAVVLSNGTTIYPITTNTPITVGIGANSETGTPTAVSNCNLPSAITVGPGTPSCMITLTLNNLHGQQEPVTTGTYGLQEAINRAHGQGGGLAIVDASWYGIGGTKAIINAAAPYSNVFIKDTSNTNGLGANYWSTQPTTLTVLAVPTTLTATNIVFTSATGTWAASSTHFTATCVDPLGGESAQSADYTQTPTVNYTLTVPVPPTCATGAVGWRLYAGTTSQATSYLLPASGCSALTTLETVVPACSLTATGTWAATFTTTTTLAPGAIGVTNTNNPVPQGHTTFAYEPTGNSLPVPFQANYGPFGSGAISSATASDVTPLGSFQLPAGYQNIIGRTVRVTGKINLTAGASSTLGVYIGTAWAGGTTAGLPITVCNPISGFVFATAASVVEFSCTMTTNAIGATAVGTIQPESWFLGNTAAGTGSTSPQGVEKSAVAVGSLGLFAQNEYTVYITPLVAADTTVQLMSLHVETLQ
jgi:hypothetical protein